MFEFQREIIRDLELNPKEKDVIESNSDGLLILCKGLDLESILISFVKVYCVPQSLVLLLNCFHTDILAIEYALKKHFSATKVHPELFRTVTSDTPSAARSALYLTGGVFSISSQILVLDILNGVIPMHLVSGLLVNHAHRIHEASLDAFVIRLFREHNKVGFIKAFSDDPSGFLVSTGGSSINSLERVLKLLFIRHVHLWPRFHVSIKQSLDSMGSVDLVELRVPLTRRMKHIQQAIFDCLSECILELKRTNPYLEDIESISIENAIFPSFDKRIASELHRMANRVGAKTRHLAKDLVTLRTLLVCLVAYDPVAFYRFLETLMVANDPMQRNSRNAINTSALDSPWLLLDASHTVFSLAKERVYRKKTGFVSNDIQDLPPGIEPILEEPPKWRAIVQILNEILKERSECEDSPIIGNNSILIMTSSISESRIIHSLVASIRRNEASDSSKNPSGFSIPSCGSYSCSGSQRYLQTRILSYLSWKRGMSQITKSFAPALISSATVASNNSGSHVSKRRRVRGGGSTQTQLTLTQLKKEDIVDPSSSKAFQAEAEHLVAIHSQNSNTKSADLQIIDTIDDSWVLDDGGQKQPEVGTGTQPFIFVRTYSAYKQTKMAESVAQDSDEYVYPFMTNSDMLNTIKPRWIIMVGPDMAFIRRIEIYKAMYPEIPVKVFFMVYDQSVEEQMYLTLVRKEKESFERLINQKSHMVIPIDQDGRVAIDFEDLILNPPSYMTNQATRIGGGLESNIRTKVIIDTREFRSSLPSALHAKKLKLVPSTLEVGDYILSPRICVERKSVPDLIQSLKSTSGRLYHQCESMSLHYDVPVLLIEFNSAMRGGGFTLGSGDELRFDGEGSDTLNARAMSSQDVRSKLVLVCLTFLKLRIIWSPNPNRTAEIFRDLKQDEEEPDVEVARSHGVETQGKIDSVYNITPVDILLALPGVNANNYRLLISKAKNLSDLFQLDCVVFQQVLGKEDGKHLYDFINKQ